MSFRSAFILPGVLATALAAADHPVHRLPTHPGGIGQPAANRAAWDPGAMVYTAETFGKDRYRFPIMSSACNRHRSRAANTGHKQNRSRRKEIPCHAALHVPCLAPLASPLGS